MKMQKMVKVQRRNGMIEEMPDWMANDQRLQRKHGWRVIHIPTTVEELKAEIKPFEDFDAMKANVDIAFAVKEAAPEVFAEVKRRGRKPKSE